MPPSVAPSVAPESMKADARSASASQASFPSISSAPPPSDDDGEDERDDEDVPPFDASEAETAAPPEVEAKAAAPETPGASEAPGAVEEAVAAAPPIEETLLSAPVVAAAPASEVMSAGPETRPSATLPPPTGPDPEPEKHGPVTVVEAKTDVSKVEGKKKRKPRVASLTPPPVEAPTADDDDDDDIVESAEHVAIQEKFFSDGDLTRHDHADDELDAIRPSKAFRLAEPAVVQRRERYSRYVKWAVAIAAVVCIAAIGRTLIVGGDPKEKNTATREAPPPPVETTKPVEAPKAEAPKPAAEPAPAPSVEPATSASAAEPAAPAVVAPAEPPTGDAKEEKKNAQTALEHRRTADAIAAGEKSVAIDPTDGEAWLILGAAYQDKGDIAAARRAFASCVKEGKTGPVAECGKMLR